MPIASHHGGLCQHPVWTPTAAPAPAPAPAQAFLFDVVSKIYLATDSSPVDMQSYELCADMIDVITDVSSIYGGEEAEEAAPPPAAPAATSSSNCVISLNNGTVLVLREVNRSLALVCILKSHALAQQARPQ